MLMRFFLKMLTTSLLLLLLVSFRAEEAGRKVYEQQCNRCHGADGTKGTFKAKNLQLSRMGDAAMRVLIMNGKKLMPAYKNKLTTAEITDVISYVKSLRK